MPGRKYDVIFETAADNFGYITVDQARDAEVSRKALHAMVRRGTLEHVSTGVYRVAAYPPSPRGEYLEAALWPRGARGVVSHDTALVLHEMSDVNPSRIHITVPTGHRVRREIPSLYVVHLADLDDLEVEFVDGIPVTTPVRTILDCHAAHLGPALVRQAIEDGLRRGVLTQAQARSLEQKCLETPMRQDD